jgi:hypothetical protein
MATSPIYGWLEPDNTDLVKNGALAIRTLGNAIDTTMGTMTPKSIVDAKGDLIAASANDTPARLAVGANGETLVADSSTSTGLRYTALFGANKNKIINGDFYVNQRSFSTVTNSASYTFDRWFVENSTASFTTTAQTFTPGAAPVAGYEGANFIRGATTTASSAGELAIIQQRIEDVRTLANQTATVSFWAKAGSGTPKLGLELAQNFGSGGSGQVNGTGQSVTLSTSWTRYSLTYSVPSISGKTIGTGSMLVLLFWLTSGATTASRSGSIGNQTATIDIWGVQIEAGSVATAFQTATGTLQGELAACQRYYYRLNAGSGFARFGSGMAYTSTLSEIIVPFPVTMRTRPTALEQSGTAGNYATVRANSGTDTLTAVPTFSASNLNSATVSLASANLVAGNATYLCELSSAAYLGWSAEL